MPPSPSSSLPLPLLGQTADSRRGTPLVERLAHEMADRWQQGDRPLVEEFLDRHPELADDPQAALRLIYEEVCLRQERAGRRMLPGSCSNAFRAGMLSCACCSIVTAWWRSRARATTHG